MRAGQAVWAGAAKRRMRKDRAWLADFWIVAMVCVILGLEIVTVLQHPGGAAALGMSASEGMQQGG